MERGGVGSLSTDSFSRILDFVTSEDAYHLYLTGNRRASDLLKRSLHTFDVSYGAKRHWKWPALISEFPWLYRVSMRPSHPFGTGYMEGVDLSEVGASLHELDLCIGNGFWAFVCDSATGLPMPPHELTQRFPNLTSLNLSSMDPKMAPHHITLTENRRSIFGLPLHALKVSGLPYSTEDISFLPRTLTILELQIVPESQDWSLAHFPPNLQKLALSGLSSFRIITMLPELIHTVSLMFENIIKADTDRFWSWLRPNLRHLTLSSCPPLDALSAQLLPPNLQTLVIAPSYVSPDAYAWLPRKLEKCKISPLSFSSPPSISISELPRTLTELPTLMDVRPHEWKQLPIAMRYFSIPTEDTEFAGSQHLPELPPFLQALKIGLSAASNLRGLTAWRLRSLMVETNVFLDLPIFESFSALPSLTFLSLSGSFDPQGLGFLQCDLKVFEASRCAVNPLTFDFGARWARSLTNFSIHGAFTQPFAHTRAWFTSLPSSLTVLRVEAENAERNPRPLALTLLPPRLTWLSLHLHSCTEQDLGSLPPTLTRLQLSTEANWDVTDFVAFHRSLPLDLIHVQLPSACFPSIAHVSHAKVLANLSPIVQARFDLQSFHVKTPTANLAFVELIAENKRTVQQRAIQSFSYVRKVPTPRPANNTLTAPPTTMNGIISAVIENNAAAASAYSLVPSTLPSSFSPMVVDQGRPIIEEAATAQAQYQY